MSSDEQKISRASLVASRVVGPAVYIALLARVQLIASGVLILTLSDWAIPGSMREAMRYSVIDAPWQLVAMIVALFLACAAIRFTSEATIELVAPDLFAADGNVGRLARLLPRALALGVALAAAMPLITLAFDASALTTTGSASTHQAYAGVTGAALVAIGAAFALFGRVKTVSTSSPLAPAVAVFRVALAVLPIAFSTVVCGAIFGIWNETSGMTFDALARYPQSGIWEIAAELLALYFCCLSARLTVAIVIELLPPLPGGTGTRLHLLRAFLPRVAGFAVGAGLAAQFLMQIFGPDGVFVPSTLNWVVAIPSLYVIVGLVAGFTELRWTAVHESSDAFMRTGRRWRAAADRLAMLSASWELIIGALFALALAVCVFFILRLDVNTARTIGPIAIILLWGFCSTLIFFPIAYASHITRMPLLLILLASGVAFAGFDLNDNHEIRGAASAPSPGHMVSAYRENIQLGDWIASRADWNEYAHYPIFLVATEGGGIRAAYFTATVLSALQDRCPQFAQHTLAISGVSGGSVGAAVFAALASDRAHNVAEAPCNLAGPSSEPVTARARTVLSADLLSPLLAKMLFPDALQRILPVPIGDFDRARGIEQALEQSWSDANPDCARCATRMSSSVEDLYSWPANSQRPPVPHLFLNTTEAKSGRIMPFATAQVVTLATPFLDQSEIDQPGLAALRQPSLQDLMVDSELSAPLSAAALLSARFPYLTPAGLLRNSGHYVDGGYFENSGTSMLSGLLQNLIGQKLTYQNAANPALEAAVRNVVFVTIIIHSEPCATSCEVVGSEGATEDTNWNEALSPVRALLNTREQRAEYSITDLDALTALVEQLAPGRVATNGPAAVDNGTGCDELLCSVTLRFGSAPNAEVPLTWLLSRPARDAMDQAVEQLRRADVRHGVPASAVIPDSSDQPSTNVVLGSYSRILCLLAQRKGNAACD